MSQNKRFEKILVKHGLLKDGKLVKKPELAKEKKYEVTDVLNYILGINDRRNDIENLKPFGKADGKPYKDREEFEKSLGIDSAWYQYSDFVSIGDSYFVTFGINENVLVNMYNGIEEVKGYDYAITNLESYFTDNKQKIADNKTAIDKNASFFDGYGRVIYCDKHLDSIGTFLIDTSGNLVGVVSNLDDSSSISMAYGISDLKVLIENMTNGVGSAYLGVRALDIDKDKAPEGMPSGIYVSEVRTDSPAYNIGIQSGDIISMIGSEEVNSITGFKNIMENIYIAVHNTFHL